jgi:hypothetical protein
MSVATMATLAQTVTAADSATVLKEDDPQPAPAGTAPPGFLVKKSIALFSILILY